MYKLTLIVAVYNLEDYIYKCLQSILPQLDNFAELLIINDGSTDKSLEIIEECIAAYPNAKVLTKENGGLGSARNYGLERASGDYVWFIDGDDEIDAEAVAKLYPAISEGTPDQIVFFTKHLRLNETEYRIESKLLSGDFYSIVDLEKKLGMIPIAVWGSIFKRQFLLTNGLFFHPRMYFEDNEFMMRFYNKVQLIRVIPEALYCYKARPGSIMKSSVNEKKVKDLLLVIQSYKAIQKDKLEYKFLEEQLFWKVNDLLGLIKNDNSFDFIRSAVYSKVPNFKIFLNDSPGITLRKVVYNSLKKIYTHLFT